MDSSAASPFLGVLYHAIGGLAAASFYLPFRRAKIWPWENAWIINGFFSWILAPAIAASILVPACWEILSQAPAKALFWSWFFGFLWGIGGLTFGLTIRYLGIALGYAIALGMCAVFGTLVPPIFDGTFGDIVASRSGQVILAGVLVCTIGIAMSGRAGFRKEKEVSGEDKGASGAGFHFGKGLFVAILAGVASACMAFGFAAGKPIAALSVEAGVAPIWQNLPVLIVVLFGGFCLNFLWCAYLIIKRKNIGVFFGQRASGAAPDSERPRLLTNYFWCAVAGGTWYLQFFFYGMGTTLMGAYEFSSWTLHMASIIMFSTIWGIILHEWKGTRRGTHVWIAAGLIALALSTIIIGWGNLLGASSAGH